MCQVLCVIDSFYTRRHPAPVSVPIPESLRDTSNVVTTAVQIFRLQIIISDFEVETRIHTTKSSICYGCVRTATINTVFFMCQEQERPRTFTIFIEMHPQRSTGVVRT